jgi:hypothetical protein
MIFLKGDNAPASAPINADGLIINEPAYELRAHTPNCIIHVHNRLASLEKK